MLYVIQYVFASNISGRYINSEWPWPCRAANSVWEMSLQEHYCVDSSADMSTIARLLLQGMSDLSLLIYMLKFICLKCLCRKCPWKNLLQKHLGCLWMIFFLKFYSKTNVAVQSLTVIELFPCWATLISNTIPTA